VTACAQLGENIPSLFDRWAAVYDRDVNPLLQLEERWMAQLLPEISGSHVLDIGCGTGRWLRRLEGLSPAALTGVDPSPAMLARAREKLSPATTLTQAGACAVPVPHQSQQLVLSSFVLSYIEDLSGFAAECFRVLTPGGAVLLTDMHPQTEATRGWTRSFHAGGESVRIVPYTRTLAEIQSAFRDQGFTQKALDEPAFGPPERQLFANSGKPDLFDALVDVPAIYLLKMEKPVTSLTLSHVRWSAGPDTWEEATLLVEGERIAATIHDPAHSIDSIDLPGYVLLPGLINAHDHLEFALYPNLGRGPDAAPYRNATEWAHEIHQTHASTIERHKQVPLTTRLWWGAIRNLLCGVTTVCHHNEIYPELQSEDFPVRVLSRFGWAHSLAFEPLLAQRYLETPADHPFILHAAEGTDKEAAEELRKLDRLHLLTDRTVLVHGLALTAADIQLLNDRGAAVILCPTSNQFLFAGAMESDRISLLTRAALGSDSPITAAGDLLDELQALVARGGLTPGLLYRLVTADAAATLRLPEGAGCIQPGGPADLIAVRDRAATPAETLSHLTFRDIELVLVQGRICLASAELYERLPESLRTDLHPLIVDGQTRWLRAPIASLLESAEAILGRDTLRLGGKEVRRAATV
jgi:cytosine/adenosine deaminase-related metal-dependent hydrolase/ubiquinone/menaquinone biosynthesis C-methylase UbiE